MKRTFLLLVMLLFYCGYVSAQNNAAATTTPLLNDSLNAAGQITWAQFLKNNVDTTVPFKNRAKKGSYTVVVRFIVTKDGSFSEIQAVSNHGYGMEKELIRVLKKSKSWTPAPQNQKPVYRAGTVSFTFTVTKRKLFGRKRPAKKRAATLQSLH